MLTNSVGILMKQGVLCQVLQDLSTGRYHYYPIKAHPDVSWAADGLQIKDMYLYVDYEDEQ